MDTRTLPIGIQDFEKIRAGGYVYIDKTALIHRLVHGSKTYFLSRPRRFGKSLLVSTLKAYWEGRKDLFTGLEIERLEGSGAGAWQPHPVLCFSLAGGSFNSPEGFADRLGSVLADFAREYGLPDERGHTLPVRFGNLLRHAAEKEGRRVAVLVDEYDKPLLETMTANPAQEELNRQLYKEFFSILKDYDAYTAFVMFTGVTKFSKVSIFSDLNQLNDISLDTDYADICGITAEELRAAFAPDIDALAAAQKLTRGECLRKLADMYDGYHFCPGGPGIYNPFSLLNAFSKRQFGSWWFATGTPTFLVKKLEASDISIQDITDGVETTEAGIRDYRADSPDPVPLFYQSGYLTIAGYDPELDIYTLEFPNREVRYGFLSSLVPAYLHSDGREGEMDVRRMVKALRAGSTDTVRDILVALFARIPYAEGREPYSEREYRNMLILIFNLLGQFTQAEVHSSRGRADAVVVAGAYRYVFEIKIGRDAGAALAQVAAKGYAEPYAAESRHVYAIGVEFSTEAGNITGWQAVEAGGAR